MKKVRKLWKDFKSKLTNKFITVKSAKEGEDPLKTYPFLTPQVWEEFKASRETEEFKAKTDLQRKRQRGNLYPHTMSRGGYLKLEDKLKKKKLEEIQTINPMSNLSLSSIEIPRHIKWRQGRITKSGTFINSDTAIIAKKIDEYDDQSSKGEFTTSGRQDILTTALGTNERPGRVRGVGGNVGLKKYFGKLTKERHYSTAEIDVMVKQRVNLELMSIMTQMGFQPVEEEQQIPEKTYMDQTDECPEDALSNGPTSEDPFGDIPAEGLKCVLMLDDNGNRRAVAIARVLSRCSGDKLHGKVLPSDQMKVTIVTPLDEEAQVAVATDEIQIVIQAAGSYIAWPKHLIDFDIEAYEKSVLKKVERGQTKDSHIPSNHIDDMPIVNTSTLPKVCKGLYAVAKRMTQSSTISIPIAAQVMNIEYILFISKLDILELLSMSLLNISCIELYMLYLYHICKKKDISNSLAFICPSKIHSGVDANERTRYIEQCLVKEKKPLYLAPYIDSGQKHWMLSVINPYEDLVYWLDPLGQSPRPQLRHAIETALRIYHMRGGVRKPGAKVTWIRVKCPRQKGGVEYGYFVMTYMKDLVNGIYDKKDPRKCFKGDVSYTQEEIDATRGEWSEFILDCETNIL